MTPEQHAEALELLEKAERLIGAARVLLKFTPVEPVKYCGENHGGTAYCALDVGHEGDHAMINAGARLCRAGGISSDWACLLADRHIGPHRNHAGHEFDVRRTG